MTSDEICKHLQAMLDDPLCHGEMTREQLDAVNAAINALDELCGHTKAQPNLQLRNAYVDGYEDYKEGWAPLKESRPLILDELMGMDGKPVWLEDGSCYLVNVNYVPPCRTVEPGGINKWGENTSLSLIARCNAYPRPPVGDTK